MGSAGRPAGRALREALRRDPDRADTSMLLGKVLLYERSCDEGPRVLKRAWQMMPSEMIIAADLARMLGFCGEEQASRYIIDSFLEPYAEPEVVHEVRTFLIYGEVERAGKLAEEGKHTDAVALLEPLVERIEDAGFRAEVAGHLARLRAAVAEKSSREIFDQALEAARNRKLVRALDLARQALDVLQAGFGALPDDASEQLAWDMLKRISKIDPGGALALVK